MVKSALIQTVFILLVITYSNEAHSANNIAQISVNPNQCALSNQGQRCQIKALITWQLPRFYSICVTQNEVMIFCQDSTEQGSKEILIDSIDDLTFKLIDTVDKLMLAEVVFPILHPSSKKVHMRKVPWRVIL